MPKCKACNNYEVYPEKMNFGLCDDCFKEIYPRISELVTEFVYYKKNEKEVK